MATGYTSAIKDDTTFQEFAWTCARAFGALILMRDDPADAPIPQEFKPSDFNKRELDAAQGELRQLNVMTRNEAIAAIAAERLDVSASRERSRAESAALRARYQRMLDMVRAWTPPTAEHVHMREFMVQQIEESIRFDCYDDEFLDRCHPEPVADPDTWLAEKRAGILRSIGRYSEEHAKELERTAGRNKWLRDLRESLASYETAVK